MMAKTQNRSHNIACLHSITHAILSPIVFMLGGIHEMHGMGAGQEDLLCPCPSSHSTLPPTPFSETIKVQGRVERYLADAPATRAALCIMHPAGGTLPRFFLNTSEATWNITADPFQYRDQIDILNFITADLGTVPECYTVTRVSNYKVLCEVNMGTVAFQGTHWTVGVDSVVALNTGFGKYSSARYTPLGETFSITFKAPTFTGISVCGLQFGQPGASHLHALILHDSLQCCC